MNEVIKPVLLMSRQELARWGVGVVEDNEAQIVEMQEWLERKWGDEERGGCYKVGWDDWRLMVVWGSRGQALMCVSAPVNLGYGIKIPNGWEYQIVYSAEMKEGFAWDVYEVEKVEEGAEDKIFKLIPVDYGLE